MLNGAEMSGRVISLALASFVGLGLFAMATSHFRWPPKWWYLFGSTWVFATILAVARWALETDWGASLELAFLGGAITLIYVFAFLKRQAAIAAKSGGDKGKDPRVGNPTSGP